eukprot:CAMPEP_0115104872 /NCGR_PEP_ID=MMETSP0227-20121206/35607_1 /TAXON_ID=89957 /ORGANISM="Polarella glacialis, Strain CCMP 1383" /LENGTH=184 /DNA_ID=CAMNT_0002501939 /DNA_START=3 /DNA_END=557 /DNA_ORIENTATION=-
MAALGSLAYDRTVCCVLVDVVCTGGETITAVVSDECLDATTGCSDAGCGVDLQGTAWNAATGNAIAGCTSCTVSLNTDTPLFSNASGAVCYYRPSFPDVTNTYYTSIGLLGSSSGNPTSASILTTGGTTVTCTTMDMPYFECNGGPLDLTGDLSTITFGFDDGSTASMSLGDCIYTGGQTEEFY